MDVRWRIELFGGLRAMQGDRVITRFRTQKTGALLAYLAYYRDRLHPREVLFELLWPECNPQSGRNSLSVALSSLRHQLEPPGVPAGAVIVADRTSVRFNPHAVVTDVAEFEAMLESASQAASMTERGQHLAEAVELYRGSLLSGYYENWILPEQQRLAGQFVEALRQLIAHLEQAGDVRRALEYARRGVSLDPLNEEVHYELMRLYVAAGQPAAALRLYREWEQTLRQELGNVPAAVPSAIMRALVRQASHQLSATGDQSVMPQSPIAATRPSLVSHPSPSLSGTITLLLINIRGSTAQGKRAQQEDPHAVLCQMFRQHGGVEVKEMDDGFVLAFARSSDALACAIASQRALTARAAPPLMRMTLHTAEIKMTGDQCSSFDSPLNIATQMLLAAHDGQILCSEGTAALLRRDLEPGVRLVDLGDYRLRGATTPERLFQVEYPDMVQREFPALNAAPAYTGNLPLSFTRFFGREREMAWLQQILPSEETRLVTLTGAGGSGKTRLALEVARRITEPLRGAVWFVPLADIADPRLIVDAISDALPLQRLPHGEPFEQVVEALSRQPTLLLLDNFEHLVEGGAEVVQTLLERVARLTCLVTSRRLLGLSCEREFLVAPLPIPTGTDTPEWLMRCESVRLFVDRAQATLPDYQVTPTNAPQVAELCRRLEGIPLAIELAAARAQMLTPTQMLVQLEHRFDFLVSRRRDAVERHRTLRAAIEWSYQLLTPELRRFFTRLSGFRGGWTLQAAEAVCFRDEGLGMRDENDPADLSLTSHPDVLDYLAQLRECSLILSEEGGAEMRFRMLETLREYAWEQLASAERRALQQHHAEYFLSLAERAESEIWGAEQTAWLNCLEAEHDNLRAALAWSVENAPETGLRLARALARFWYVRGYLSEGRRWLDAVLSRNEGITTSERAWALIRVVSLARDQGDYAQAAALGRESLSLFRELKDQKGVAASLHNLGLIAFDQADYATASSLSEEALSLQRALGDQWSIALSLNNLGMVALGQSDYARATALCRESLSLFQELKNKWGIATSLIVLGEVAYYQGDHAQAASLHEESLALSRELGNRRGMALSLSRLGLVAHHQQKDEHAKALLEESLTLFREIGDRWGTARALSHLGRLAQQQGDPATARSLFQQALTLSREIGNRIQQAYNLMNLVSVARMEGDHAAARALLEESLTTRRELDDREGIAECLEEFASLAAAQGHPAKAARLLGAAEILRHTLNAPVPAADGDDYKRSVAAVRAALREEEFAAAWTEGRALTWEQAVAEALKETA